MNICMQLNIFNIISSVINFNFPMSPPVRSVGRSVGLSVGPVVLSQLPERAGS